MDKNKNNVMKLTINGEEQQIDVDTLKELLQEYDIDGNGNSNEKEKGVAVAVNDSVVSKDRWENHKLEDEDRIEIIRATQGG